MCWDQKRTDQEPTGLGSGPPLTPPGHSVNVTSLRPGHPTGRLLKGWDCNPLLEINSQTVSAVFLS